MPVFQPVSYIAEIYRLPTCRNLFCDLTAFRYTCIKGKSGDHDFEMCLELMIKTYDKDGLPDETRTRYAFRSDDNIKFVNKRSAKENVSKQAYIHLRKRGHTRKRVNVLGDPVIIMFAKNVLVHPLGLYHKYDIAGRHTVVLASYSSGILKGDYRRLHDSLYTSTDKVKIEMYNLYALASDIKKFDDNSEDVLIFKDMLKEHYNNDKQIYFLTDIPGIKEFMDKVLSDIPKNKFSCITVVYGNLQQLFEMHRHFQIVKP